MKSTFKKALAVGVVALGLGAGSAQATFIVGSIGFSDGGITLSMLPSSIVNQLTSVTLGPASTTGCSGVNFSPAFPTCFNANTVNLVGSMTLPAVSGGMDASFTYVVAGDTYTFHITSIVGTITRTPNSDSGGGLISDHMNFLAVGTVTDSLALYQTTAASLRFSADGTCTSTTGTTDCDAGTANSSWAGVLNALGRNQAPEPATLGLLGIALAGLGFSRRRKQK